MKNVLITGASRGIGRAIALEFAKKGYDVCINCVREKGKLDELAEMIRKECKNSRVIEYFGDISDADFVRSMFDDIKDKFGGLDVLINNAGISKIGLFTEMSDDEWRRICGVNLDGVVWCSREAVKLMLEKHSGKIINISSMWGQVGASCEVAYSATKGGVDSLTRALAKELAPSGIQVNAVSCGVIDTDMNAGISDEVRESLTESIPAGRFGTPYEVAELVTALCEGKDYLTGQIIRIDGGLI